MKLSTSLPNTLLLFAGVLLGYEGCAPRNVGKASPSGGQSDTRKAHHTPEETLPDSLIEKVRNTDLKRFLRNLRNNPGAIDTKATSEDNPVAYTALQLAVSEKNIKVLEGLLKVGANPNVVLDPYRKHTALLEAATILPDVCLVAESFQLFGVHGNSLGLTSKSPLTCTRMAGAVVYTYRRCMDSIQCGRGSRVPSN